MDSGMPAACAHARNPPGNDFPTFFKRSEKFLFDNIYIPDITCKKLKVIRRITCARQTSRPRLRRETKA